MTKRYAERPGCRGISTPVGTHIQTHTAAVEAVCVLNVFNQPHIQDVIGRQQQEAVTSAEIPRQNHARPQVGDRRRLLAGHFPYGAAHQSNECIHYLRVVALASGLDQHCTRLLRTQTLVRQGADLQAVLVIGHGQDARAERNGGALQAVRKALAVKAFMMRADDACSLFQFRRTFDTLLITVAPGSNTNTNMFASTPA